MLRYGNVGYASERDNETRYLEWPVWTWWRWD